MPEENLGFDPPVEEETPPEEQTPEAEVKEEPEVQEEAPELPEVLRDFVNDGELDVHALAADYVEKHGQLQQNQSYIGDLKRRVGERNQLEKERNLYKEYYETLKNQSQVSEPGSSPGKAKDTPGSFKLPEDYDGVLDSKDFELNKNVTKQALQEILADERAAQAAKVQEIQGQLEEDLVGRYDLVYSSLAESNDSFKDEFKARLIADEIRNDPDVKKIYDAYLQGRATISEQDIKEAIVNADARLTEKLTGIKAEKEKPLMDLKKQIAGALTPTTSQAAEVPTENAPVNPATKTLGPGWI
jgi:hypothetical protein